MICPKCGVWVENECVVIEERILTDEDAEIEIKNFLREMKKKGATSFDMIDVVQGTGLGADQIDRILEKLRKEVKE